MKRNKLKKIIIIALLTCSISAIAKYGLNCYTKPAKAYNINSIHNISKDNKIDLETIVDELKEVSRHEIMQAFVTKDIKIKSNKTENFLTKNIEYINFKGIGHYYIDFNKINDNQIQIDDEKREVTIFLSNPILEVELLEDKTEFKTEKGILIFSDIKLTFEQTEKIKNEAKNNIYSKLSEEDYIKEVNGKTEKILNDLVTKITKNEYNINIRFV